MKKKLEKQSFEDSLQNRYSKNFCKFHRKRPVLEFLFNKKVVVAAFEAKHIHSSVALLLYISNGNLDWSEGMRKKLNVFMLQLPIGANACIAKTKGEK